MAAQDEYQQAAKALNECTMLLVACGAGMSADSGLAVYVDIAKIACYQERGIEYDDLCRAPLAQDDPELFFGFWGRCVNDYRRAQPHKGHDILRRWKQRIGERAKQSGNCEAEWKANLESSDRFNVPKGNEDGSEQLEYLKHQNWDWLRCTRLPFFVYTSNVDAHFLKAGFNFDEIYEIHGNGEQWQCGAANGPCRSDSVWFAPRSLQFDVDDSNGQCKAVQVEDTQISSFCKDAQDSSSESPTTDDVMTGFRTKFPSCVFCGDVARPNILMFGDYSWVKNSGRESAYTTWERAVEDTLESCPQAKFVILEIGAGTKVPSVRNEVEWVQKDCLERAPGQSTLIRINYDPRATCNESCPEHTIGIASKGLAALESIDKAWTQLRK